MINPHLIIAALVTVLGAAGGGFWFGMDYKEGQVAEQENDKLREQGRALTAAIERNDGIAQELEDEKRKRKVIYRNIKTNVIQYRDRVVYQSACIDDDGLRDANRALRGGKPDPGQPEAAVPGPDGDGGPAR